MTTVQHNELASHLFAEQALLIHACKLNLVLPAFTDLMSQSLIRSGRSLSHGPTEETGDLVSHSPSELALFIRWTGELSTAVTAIGSMMRQYQHSRLFILLSLYNDLSGTRLILSPTFRLQDCTKKLARNSSYCFFAAV